MIDQPTPRDCYAAACTTIVMDQAASDWLKSAVNALAWRDPVDALNDVECLAKLCRLRCNESVEVEHERVTVTLHVTDQQCADIMCTGLEGGIGYWAQARNIERSWHYPQDGQFEYVRCELAESKADESDYDWSKPLQLDYAAIRRGIARLFTAKVSPDIPAQVLRELTCSDCDGCACDAEAADAIVQLALLNEIRYG